MNKDKEQVVDHNQLFYMEGGERCVDMDVLFTTPAFKHLMSEEYVEHGKKLCGTSDKKKPT